jgi:hypothetical protein
MGIGASIFGYLWTLWFFISFWLIVWLLFYLRAARGNLISQRWVFPIICSSCFWGIYKHFSSTLFKTHNEWFVGVVSVLADFFTACIFQNGSCGIGKRPRMARLSQGQSDRVQECQGF